MGRIVAECQAKLVEELGKVYENVEIKKEWASFNREKIVYSPRLDVAVGPFSVTGGRRMDIEYDRMIKSNVSKVLFRALAGYNKENLARYDPNAFPVTYERLIDFNKNARCFIAIEIENRVSRKHLMGGAINASTLGRVGIVVPWSDKQLKATVRLIGYFRFLATVEKNTFNTTNLLVITWEQMIRSLAIAIRSMDSISRQQVLSSI